MCRQEGTYRLMGTLRFVHPFMPSRFKNLPWRNLSLEIILIGARFAHPTGAGKA